MNNYLGTITRQSTVLVDVAQKIYVCHPGEVDM